MFVISFTKDKHENGSAAHSFHYGCKSLFRGNYSIACKLFHKLLMPRGDDAYKKQLQALEYECRMNLAISLFKLDEK